MSQQLEKNFTQTLSPVKAPATRRWNQRSHQAILKATAELIEKKDMVMFGLRRSQLVLESVNKRSTVHPTAITL